MLTAHPTFALNHDLSIALIELASGHTAGGEPLVEEARAKRLAWPDRTRMGPPRN